MLPKVNDLKKIIFVILFNFSSRNCQYIWHSPIGLSVLMWTFIGLKYLKWLKKKPCSLVFATSDDEHEYWFHNYLAQLAFGKVEGLSSDGNKVRTAPTKYTNILVKTQGVVGWKRRWTLSTAALLGRFMFNNGRLLTDDSDGNLFYIG